MNTTTKQAFTPNSNQAAIMKALDAGKTAAGDIAKAKGVKIGPTSIYAALRRLKDRGIVVEQTMRRSKVSNKGDRVEFRLSAKGKRHVAKL